ncbi:deaminated glutathione amidase [Microlunatus soli]|uniref:Predicted amidohydrolase n=1 Tax=Microlunatus soli TaxID=630515 RepID=A0A1H1ZXC7_9ACTN|nr:deaminated glutathione amidase [Microlunatus soli]SDT38435.1 Predicted amidohydrolase [Microlunatus soli]
MKIALGQMRVADDWQQNLASIGDLAGRAVDEGARLLVLPEGIIARDPDDPDLPRRAAQPVDGPFVSGLRDLSERHGLAIAGTVHVPDQGKAINAHVVIDRGDLIARYDKLHLYDAFASLESDHVVPGDEVPPIVRIDDFAFGLMTCYDVRFPELARALAVAGADALLLPAAWVRGPLKEDHWRVMVTARAVENTVYLIGVGEISARNIGRSLVVDPLGVTIAAGAEQPTLLVASLDRRRIEEARSSLPVLQNRRFGTPVLGRHRSSEAVR